MEVIFLTDVKGVAKRGEQKVVNDGYYRNFLLPKRVAVPLSDPAAVKLRTELAAKVQADRMEVEAIKQQAAALAGKKLVITAKAQGDKLFGAIHETQVAEQLGIDKKLIRMTPIKTVGEHAVRLQFPHHIEATIHLTVKAA